MTMSFPQPVVVDGWPRPAGYADGMTGTGRMLTTAGMIGWNPETQVIENDNFTSQAAQALRNVVAVLAAAGAEPNHIVHLRWYITNRDEYLAAREGVGRAYRQIIGRHYPAMSVLVVAGLLEPRARVEIEATAVI